MVASTPKESAFVKPGSRSSKTGRRCTERSQGLRLSLGSSSASLFATEGDADSDCVSICTSDEGAGEGRKTLSTRASQHSSSASIETRGRNPKDPTAKAAKMEAKNLQGQVCKKQAEKEKMEERARLQEELGDLIREGGLADGGDTGPGPPLPP